MQYIGKILSRANASLAEVREENSRESDRRKKKIYAQIPEIREIDTALRSQMVTLAKLVLSGDSDQKIAELKDSNLSLQMRKRELLVKNGYSRDFLEDIYSCQRCHDSGYTANSMCECLKKLYNIELTKDLSALLKNGNESFDNFNLSLYPEDCRDHMAQVLNLAKEYSDIFPKVQNLLFQGGTGLGKTYLSACIAREVSKKGYSVFYNSAIDIFRDFDNATFKGDEEAQKRVDSLYECDLLILDDLGTEMLLPSVVSNLYSIINSRINSSKCMIINTNLSKDNLMSRYSDAIGSRIDGYFTELPFVGEDIRKKLQ